MVPRQISIRRPTASFKADESAPVFNLGRSIRGLRVGMRTDKLWLSWEQICGIWSDLLKKDGAEPVMLQVDDHSSESTGRRTLDQLRAWAASVDCAVVGLAN